MSDANNPTPPESIASDRAETLSFDEAFTLHHRAVFRTARAVVRDSALAEDVTQEVFLRLYRNLNTVPSEDLLRAWLLRVALNVARNTLRGKSRSVIHDSEYQRTGADVPLIETPEGDYERKLAIEEARRALDKIKEPMRSCLILKQQGLSYREIARSLSLSETTAVSMVSQGRKQFETAYQSFGGSVGVGSIAKDLDDVRISTESVLLEDSERERLSARLDDLLPKINKIQSSLESDQFEIEELRKKTRSILALLPAQ